jgi:hypothetical protein
MDRETFLVEIPCFTENELRMTERKSGEERERDREKDALRYPNSDTQKKKGHHPNLRSFRASQTPLTPYPKMLEEQLP